MVEYIHDGGDWQPSELSIDSECCLIGYRTAGDLGGGIYYLDNSSPDADNGEVIIDVTGKAWGDKK